jgi:hypothetical protein
MKKIRGLQLLVYITFGLLIAHNVLPNFIRGFKDGFNDGYNQANGIKSHGDMIPAVLSDNHLSGPISGDLKIDETYALHNVSINADVAVIGSMAVQTWVSIGNIILVFAIAIVLIMIAYNINMVIVNIANGNIFDAICIRHIRRAGLLLLIYSITDVIYQRFCIAQLRDVIHAPLQVVNTTEFNFEVLICAILAFIIAEAFKKGALLKAEQDLTI